MAGKDAAEEHTVDTGEIAQTRATQHADEPTSTQESAPTTGRRARTQRTRTVSRRRLGGGLVEVPTASRCAIPRPRS